MSTYIFLVGFIEGKRLFRLMQVFSWVGPGARESVSATCENIPFSVQVPRAHSDYGISARNLELLEHS